MRPRWLVAPALAAALVARPAHPQDGAPRGGAPSGGGGDPGAAQEAAGGALPAPTPPPLLQRSSEPRAREVTLHRDPFRPFALAREQAKQPGQGSPLQQYQVGQLRLVGVIDDGKPTAIVEDDQRNGYVIGLGTEIGPNGGVVTAIRGRQVTVVEWETDIVGERHRKEYVLQMPTDEPVRQEPRG